MSSSAQRRIKQAGTLLQRNFDHMDPRLPNNKGMRLVPGEQERTPKYIRPKDRIRQFNLTIGDKVLVTKGNEKIKGRIGTIARMDRTQNICWLAEHEFQRIRLQSTGRKGLTLDPEYQPRNNPTPLPIHYSNLKLVLPSDDPFDPPKIATRLKATPATWSTTRNAFSWSRYPEAVKQLEISTDGRAKLAPKEIWDVGAEATDSMSPVKVKVKHPRVPWPNEGKTAEERGKPVYEPGPSETRAEAVQRESFIPISTPFRRDVPELRIPYQEFGGGPFSRARRTARWNARNRDPKTGKIIAQRPGKPYSRRLARINWDRPTKSHPEGLRKSLSQSLSSSAAVAQQQQQVT